MIPLLVGALLSLIALSFVLYPLLFDSKSVSVLHQETAEPQRNPALEALREIEFDRETGKLSDADYWRSKPNTPSEPSLSCVRVIIRFARIADHVQNTTRYSARIVERRSRRKPITAMNGFGGF